MKSAGAVAVEFRRVGFAYPGGPAVFSEVDLAVPAGSFQFVSGPSGAGKTTLLRLMLRALRPSPGRVLLFGEDGADLSGRALAAARRRIGAILQDVPVLDHLAAWENVAVPLLVRGLDRERVRSEALELLGWVGLGDKAGAPTSALSDGERQRVAIARAVVTRPALVLADEPTSNLDPPLARRMLRLFVELNRLGSAVVLATPDVALMDQVDAGRLILAGGRLLDDP